MSAPLNPRLLKLATRLDDLVGELVRREQEKVVRAVLDRRERAARADLDIMAACRAVGDAYDALEQAKFAGAPEVPARRALERAASRLAGAMRRHGRGS